MGSSHRLQARGGCGRPSAAVCTRPTTQHRSAAHPAPQQQSWGAAGQSPAVLPPPAAALPVKQLAAHLRWPRRGSVLGDGGLGEGVRCAHQRLSRQRPQLLRRQVAVHRGVVSGAAAAGQQAGGARARWQSAQGPCGRVRRWQRVEHLSSGSHSRPAPSAHAPTAVQRQQSRVGSIGSREGGSGLPDEQWVNGPCMVR